MTQRLTTCIVTLGLLCAPVTAQSPTVPQLIEWYASHPWTAIHVRDEAGQPLDLYCLSPEVGRAVDRMIGILAQRARSASCS